MKPRFRFWAGAAVAASIAFAPILPASAASVGDILVCYACNLGFSPGGTGNTDIDAALSAHPDVAGDGILFAFQNTSGTAISGGLFSVSSVADSFVIPTIAANSTYILMPGISNDGNGHPSNGLFFTTGGTNDTSDSGSVSDSSIFSFTGLSGLLAVTSNGPGSPGIFSPGNPALLLPWRDSGKGQISFIGQGPSNDGGCNNCYFGQVATLDVPDVSTTPLPAALPLFATGLGAMGLLGWRRKRKAAVLAA